ncbi:putative membrane protein [Synechococcus sp. BIOS-U3-1]|uniref:hypothetical protein n=1 Tax=Synechococcus sp. BIOS-U3-1 TaxID=1400865 RepID=UPI00164756E1|nr:hypothetical protein [Synechococcus sp. BIOS-U3-1]QNI59511.1 putative membrane protein [Synechococcus sp. BIOS-U3-1]|tara:strand:+ start:321 stop:539 length:219 start_codon:yes stop_codon:yes gene_type:complete
MKITEQIVLKACGAGAGTLMLFAAGFSLGSHLEREQGCRAGLPIQLEKGAVVLAFSLVFGFGIYDVTQRKDK